MNEKNKALKQFLQTITPKKNIQELARMQYASNKLDKPVYSPQNQDTKKEMGDEKKSISTSLKKRIIQELLQHEKGAQYCSSISSSTLEAVEDMIDIVTLSDGSILVRPKKQWRSNTAKKYEPTQRLQVISINDKPQQMATEYSTMIQGRKINVNANRQIHIKTRSQNPPTHLLPVEAEESPKPSEETKDARIVSRESPLERRKKYWASNKLLVTDKPKPIMKPREIKSPPTKVIQEQSTLEPVKLGSKKPEANITVTQKEYTHLYNHPINIALRTINYILTAIFKTKDGILNPSGIIKYSKLLGLSINKSKMSQDYLKSKETSNYMKEKAFWYLCNSINTENKINPPQKQVANYKFYVGKGNNSMLVRAMLKQRWWWTAIDRTEIENANLVWTQLVSKRIMAVLPSSKKKGESTSSSTSTTLDNEHHSEEKKKEDIQLANHLENHIHISNKKALFLNLRNYFEKCHKNPFDIIPLTFHIKGLNDPELQKFEEYYMSLQKDSKECNNIWILKPGEFSNRGNGITVCKDLAEIKMQIKRFEGKRTTIVQKYIEKPLLIHKRKFDIRCYGMLTSINGLIKGYFHSEGYLRTSSKEFNNKCLTNKYIHLTNDAVQQNNEDYGKYEPGNKLSYNDFQKYLDTKYPDKNIDFNRDINSQIKVHKLLGNNY